MVIKNLYVILLLSVPVLCAQDIIESEIIDEENILHFIALNENDDYIKLRKTSIPLLQDILEEKHKKDAEFFTSEHVLTTLGLGIISLNFIFLFRLFDTVHKNGEEIELLKRDLQEDKSLLASTVDQVDVCKETLSKLRESNNVLVDNFAKMKEGFFQLKALYDESLTLHHRQVETTSKFAGMFQNLSDEMKGSVAADHAA